MLAFDALVGAARGGWKAFWPALFAGCAAACIVLRQLTIAHIRRFRHIVIVSLERRNECLVRMRDLLNHFPLVYRIG